VLWGSPAPLESREQRADATDEAEDAEDPEYGATPVAHARDEEDEPCEQEPQATMFASMARSR
jgi:hypothetical protein